MYVFDDLGIALFEHKIFFTFVAQLAQVFSRSHSFATLLCFQCLLNTVMFEHLVVAEDVDVDDGLGQGGGEGGQEPGHQQPGHVPAQGTKWNQTLIGADFT